MLEAAGLTDEEESVYRGLVAHPGATAGDLAAALDRAGTDTLTLLTTLERKSLVTRTPERPPRYRAVRPDLALHPVLARREEELRAAYGAVRDLLDTFRVRNHDRSGSELVEVVVGAAPVLQRFAQAQRQARREILALVRPPFAVPHGQNDAEHGLLARGVTARAIYERSVLELPTEMAQIERFTAAGEQARILDDLPVKGVIVDGMEAFLPLSEAPGEPTFVVVHGSGLLNACIALFELLWARATPLSRGGAPDGEVTEMDRRLLGLLLAGATDEAAARQLGVGVRTVQRRTRALMDLVGARNRMQLGWHAATRGWLS